VYLTNTLDRIAGKTGQLMAQWLTQEAEGAERVKNQLPVEVVLGNPPYSGKAGKSRNKSAWVMELIELYKREPDGSVLKERSKGNLNSDEIKFIRFAHWRIAKTGHGIVGFIAPHTWLDGVTFRGMRAALRRDFDDIYVLDLHGNSNKGETTPVEHAQYGDDKNVFDILQGVAILFLVRRPGDRQRNASVHHAELWGTRESKYQRLEDAEFEQVVWNELDPQLPQMMFAPISRDAWDGYKNGWSVTKIFPLYGAGFMTKSDDLNIHWSDEEAWNVIRWFATVSDAEARKRFKLPKPEVRDWKFEWAQKDATAPNADGQAGPHRDLIRQILYRPFDIRYTYYTGQSRGVMGWPVTKIMCHVRPPAGIALVTTRMTKGEEFAHAIVTDEPAEKISLSSKSSNNAFVFPLWLVPEHDTLDPAKNVRHPNLDPRYLQALADALGVGVTQPFGLPDGVTPEDTFHFIYAVLHAPTYRSRYAEYLRSDFPRIPLPPNEATFRALAALGARLVELHLLRDSALDEGAPAFPVSGSGLVEKPRYEAPALTPTPLPQAGEGLKGGRVWINKTQYFEGIDPDTWAFRVGGYQVLEKWLKDRKGRELGIDDIVHYRRVAVALRRTRELMRQVDECATPLWAAETEGTTA
jgi:predicted helicase